MLWKGFQRPKRLEFERETLTDRFGRFYAQPFERGFGTTIGNAPQRVLLSSIEGAAITAVKIDGVLHEFSPIPGVVEDATDIILNLKQIPLKLHSDQTKTLTLRIDKPGEVRGRDIQADGDVEILEPDAHIATVGEGGKLHMEMRMRRGRGYVSADKNFDEDLGIGWIPIDSVHSPVKKVNYLVEAARLGQTTDYDKLTVDVWTNGSVTPRDAVSRVRPTVSAASTTSVSTSGRSGSLGRRATIDWNRKKNRDCRSESCDIAGINSITSCSCWRLLTAGGWRRDDVRYPQSGVQRISTSRLVPQHTAQISCPSAGHWRFAGRERQRGQSIDDPTILSRPPPAENVSPR
jgi:DNA-directed RNA polymerase alpha subunit